MRLGVFSVLLGLVATPVLAVTFQTPLEKVEWAVEGDRFECRLTQPVKDFGLGEFVRRAGEGPVFRLHTQERWLARGSATLFAAAATWRERDGHINLGPVLWHRFAVFAVASHTLVNRDAGRTRPDCASPHA